MKQTFVSRAAGDNAQRVDYEKLYRENEDFHNYVDRALRGRTDITREEFLKHKLVQEVGDMYADKPNHQQPNMTVVF